MKYKLGDKVRIRKDLNEDEYYGGTRCNPSMSELKERIATINYFNEDEKFYRIDLDNMYYRWTDAMFQDLVEYTYEDLCKAPIGTKITFENKEVYVKDNDYFFLGCMQSYLETSWLEGLTEDCIGKGKIIKIEEPCYTTVYEIKDILDKKEKEYLSNVIKPFKNKISYIRKYKDGSNSLYEYLSMKYRNDIDEDYKETSLKYYFSCICLPSFKKRDNVQKNGNRKRILT